MLDGREENLSGITLIKMLLGIFPQGSMLLENFVKLSLIVMFQIYRPPGPSVSKAD